MASITLSVTHPIVNLYRPYPGYNHHFTQVGFNCELLGDVSSYVAPNNIYYYLYSGNNPATLPPYVTGNVTSATSNTFVDTSKNFLASSLSWLGDGGESWICITGGTGSGQIKKVAFVGSNYLQTDSNWLIQPNSSSTYCVGKYWQRVRAEFENDVPNLYLPHADYTILTMAFDSNGIPRIARNYINVNNLLAAAPVVHNSVSPQIIFKKEDIIGGQSHVKIKANPGDLVKLYWRYVVDEDKLVSLYPGQDDGSANHGSGVVLIKKRILAFRANPLASGFADSSGEIQFDLPATQIAAASGDRWVVAEAKTPGFGESFSTAAVKVFQQTGPPYTADAEDMRQNKIYFTATTATRNTAGYLERKYDVLVKNINLYTGVESDYASQADFYYNINNNGNAYNLPISDGIWAKVGGTTTVLIIDQNANGSTAGTPYSYWSTHIIDAGIAAPTTKTAYTSLTDAITRGPNTAMAKDERTWYSDGWDLSQNDKVYINNSPDDTTTTPAGFYFIADMNMAIQIDSAGAIISRQVVGGVAQY